MSDFLTCSRSVVNDNGDGWNNGFNSYIDLDLVDAF